MPATPNPKRLAELYLAHKDALEAATKARDAVAKLIPTREDFATAEEFYDAEDRFANQMGNLRNLVSVLTWSSQDAFTRFSAVVTTFKGEVSHG